MDVQERLVTSLEAKCRTLCDANFSKDLQIERLTAQIATLTDRIVGVEQNCDGEVQRDADGSLGNMAVGLNEEENANGSNEHAQ